MNHLIEIGPSLAGVALETLAPFDTLRVQTRKSEYRIFLLDPRSGRALVEGGRDFLQPVEATVYGSNLGNSAFKVGWIGIGLRMEFGTDGKLTSTSPVQSFQIEPRTPAESVPSRCY